MDRNLLEDYRKQVDDVDKEILFLIKRRFQLAKKIAEYKKKNDIEIHDIDREEEIINKCIALAKEMKIPSSFIRKIYQEILEESKIEMQHYIAKKFKETGEVIEEEEEEF